MTKQNKTDKNKGFGKNRFTEYLTLLNQIQLKKEQLNVITGKLSKPGSAKLSDIPKTKQAAPDKTLYLIQEKIEVEQELEKLKKKRKTEWNILSSAVKKLECPESAKLVTRERDTLTAEACILRLRYFCAFSWDEINNTFHGDEADFDIKADDYLKKIFRNHGKAFIDLPKIMKG